MNNSVPLQELIALRDRLCEFDKISMRGLIWMNQLIARYGAETRDMSLNLENEIMSKS